MLYCLIENSQLNLKTSTYRKSTYSGLVLNCTSFTSCFYKIGLIKRVIDRAYKINITWPGFMMMSQKLKTFSKEILILLLFQIKS